MEVTENQPTSFNVDGEIISYEEYQERKLKEVGTIANTNTGNTDRSDGVAEENQGGAV